MKHYVLVVFVSVSALAQVCIAAPVDLSKPLTSSAQVGARNLQNTEDDKTMDQLRPLLDEYLDIAKLHDKKKKELGDASLRNRITSDDMAFQLELMNKDIEALHNKISSIKSNNLELKNGISNMLNMLNAQKDRRFLWAQSMKKDHVYNENDQIKGKELTASAAKYEKLADEIFVKYGYDKLSKHKVSGNVTKPGSSGRYVMAVVCVPPAYYLAEEAISILYRSDEQIFTRAMNAGGFATYCQAVFKDIGEQPWMNSIKEVGRKGNATYWHALMKNGNSYTGVGGITYK